MNEAVLRSKLMDDTTKWSRRMLRYCPRGEEDQQSPRSFILSRAGLSLITQQHILFYIVQKTPLVTGAIIPYRFRCMIKP